MEPWYVRTRYIVLGLFLASSLAAFGYQWWFIWPVRKCDREGLWWDAKDHQCLSPMPIWRITGHMPRPEDKPAAPAAPAKP